MVKSVSNHSPYIVLKPGNIGNSTPARYKQMFEENIKDVNSLSLIN